MCIRDRYDTFATADGTLVLAVGNDAQWSRCCEVLGMDAAAKDARFATNAGRVEHYPELRSALNSALGRVTLADVVARLRDSGVPCGAVRSIGDALADPQTRAREMIQQVLHPTLGPIQVLGVPVKLSDTPGSVRTAPPLLDKAQEPPTTKGTKATKR